MLGLLCGTCVRSSVSVSTLWEKGLSGRDIGVRVTNRKRHNEHPTLRFLKLPPKVSSAASTANDGPPALVVCGTCSCTGMAAGEKTPGPAEVLGNDAMTRLARSRTR